MDGRRNRASQLWDPVLFLVALTCIFAVFRATPRPGPPHDEEQEREGDGSFEEQPEEIHALLYSIDVPEVAFELERSACRIGSRTRGMCHEPSFRTGARRFENARRFQCARSTGAASGAAFGDGFSHAIHAGSGHTRAEPLTLRGVEARIARPAIEGRPTAGARGIPAGRLA
jgi:hypothetical protein